MPGKDILQSLIKQQWSCFIKGSCPVPVGSVRELHLFIYVLIREKFIISLIFNPVYNIPCRRTYRHKTLTGSSRKTFLSSADKKINIPLISFNRNSSCRCYCINIKKRNAKIFFQFPKPFERVESTWGSIAVNRSQHQGTYLPECFFNYRQVVNSWIIGKFQPVYFSSDWFSHICYSVCKYTCYNRNNLITRADNIFKTCPESKHCLTCHHDNIVFCSHDACKFFSSILIKQTVIIIKVSRTVISSGGSPYFRVHWYRSRYHRNLTVAFIVFIFTNLIHFFFLYLLNYFNTLNYQLLKAFPLLRFNGCRKKCQSGWPFCCLHHFSCRIKLKIYIKIEKDIVWKFYSLI